MTTLAPNPAKTARKKPAELQLSAAYAVCRSITRASAKNFYYAFVALPRRKRDALCAVYAFMRHADDISDDPEVSDEDKRQRLGAWLEGFHRVNFGRATDDPVLLALADTQQRFKIPVQLLERLVYGTSMDVRVEPVSAGEPPAVPYTTFKDLYQYCYHVASVVGLVCIRIFGYRNPQAEELAEKTGIAFQLTNIIRDVKEDAKMGRIYLPQDDLQAFGLTPEHFVGQVNPDNFKPLLKLEADRAREYYKSGYELIPLLDADARAAMWVLVEIYSRLLEKIAKADYNVFTGKVRLTTAEKLKVLGKGFFRRFQA